MIERNSLKYVPGMPWKLDDEGNRVPDIERIDANPFPSPYTHSQRGGRPVLACPPDSSMTQQEFKEECDINQIMRRFKLTGALPTTAAMPMYGDFSEVTDYMDALNQITFAQQQFAELPALLRERFNHNPGQLLAFLSDSKNRDEAIRLGLLPTPPANSNAKTPPDSAEPVKAKTND